MSASLRRLEAALGLSAGSDQAASALAPYARLREIARDSWPGWKADQGITPHAGADLNARIDALRINTAERLAAALHTSLPRAAPFPVAVQALANVYDDFVDQAGEARAAEGVRHLYRLWLRLKNYVAVRDGYVSEWPSAERFLDVLGRLEVDGRRGAAGSGGPRRAAVRIGTPIDLKRIGGRVRREAARDAGVPHGAARRGRQRSLLDELARTAPPMPAG